MDLTCSPAETVPPHHDENAKIYGICDASNFSKNNFRVVIQTTNDALLEYIRRSRYSRIRILQQVRISVKENWESSHDGASEIEEDCYCRKSISWLVLFFDLISAQRMKVEMEAGYAQEFSICPVGICMRCRGNGYGRGQTYLRLWEKERSWWCGFAQIGKSSLTVQFVDGHFVESYYPTIENTFSKVIKYKNQEFATEIIDTAGQVRISLPWEKMGYRFCCIWHAGCL